MEKKLSLALLAWEFLDALAPRRDCSHGKKDNTTVRGIPNYRPFNSPSILGCFSTKARL